MSTTTSPCKTFYFVHLNENQEPIPSTMFAKNNAKLDKGYSGCNEALLSTTQMTIPAGKSRCFKKSHFRYFYKVNSQTRQILQNSMWQQIGKPRTMCSGIYQTLEYIVTT